MSNYVKRPAPTDAEEVESTVLTEVEYASKTEKDINQRMEVIKAFTAPLHEIAKCAKCGSTPMLQRKLGITKYVFSVYCPNCGQRSKRYTQASPEATDASIKAVSYWNTRQELITTEKRTHR